MWWKYRSTTLCKTKLLSHSFNWCKWLLILTLAICILSKTEPREELVQVNGLKYDEIFPTANNTFRTTVSWGKPLFTHSDVQHYSYKVVAINSPLRKRRETLSNTIITMVRGIIFYQIRENAKTVLAITHKMCSEVHVLYKVTEQKGSQTCCFLISTSNFLHNSKGHQGEAVALGLVRWTPRPENIVLHSHSAFLHPRAWMNIT